MPFESVRMTFAVGCRSLRGGRREINLRPSSLERVPTADRRVTRREASRHSPGDTARCRGDYRARQRDRGRACVHHDRNAPVLAERRTGPSSEVERGSEFRTISRSGRRWRDHWHGELLSRSSTQEPACGEPGHCPRPGLEGHRARASDDAGRDRLGAVGRNPKAHVRGFRDQPAGARPLSEIGVHRGRAASRSGDSSRAPGGRGPDGPLGLTQVRARSHAIERRTRSRTIARTWSWRGR